MPFPEHLAELDRRHRARLEATVEQLRRSFEQRVRAASEGLTSALADLGGEMPAPLFEATELAPLEAEARQGGAHAALDALLESAIAFDRSASQGAVLDALLAGARHFAPRAGILIADADGARGWRSAGFAAGDDPLAGRASAWQGAALVAFAEGRGVVGAEGAAAADLADRLGLPAATGALLVPLVLRDRIAAALYVDRRAGEPELPMAALQLLALGAAQRLELQSLSQRGQTPTLFGAATAPLPGLPLWDAAAVTAREAAPEPPPIAAVAAPVEAWSDEAAGAVFELEPEAIEAEPAPPEPVAPEPDRIEAPIARSGIEELFEAYEAPAAAPEPPSEPAAAAETLAPAPSAPPPVWSGPEMVSWAAPEAAAPAPASDTWSAPGAVSWAASAATAAASAPPPPLPDLPLPDLPPPGAPEWEMEPGESTVFQGGAPSIAVPAPPEPPAPLLPLTTLVPMPAREEVTAPFTVAATETRALPTGFDLAPRGSATSEIELPETTAPIPLTPPAGASATIAVPTVAMPFGHDLADDATVLVSRTPVAPPPAPPIPAEPAESTEDATQLVSRPGPIAPPPPVEATEDQTHPSLANSRPGAEEDVNERTAARSARGTEVAAPPDLQGPGLAFTMSRTQRASGENALHEEARRLARLLISEIKLYNEEQVEEGRRHRDLYLRLREDIDRSRQIYDERVHDSVRGTTDYFQQELIRSLAGGDPRALGI